LGFDASVPLPIVIPRGTQFFVSLAGGQQLTFETQRDVTILALTPPDAANLRYFSPLPVVEGRTTSGEVIGVSDGSPNQIHRLKQAQALLGSIDVFVNEPGGRTRYEVVASLSQSTPADRRCVAQRSADGFVDLLFGDGVNGRIPPRGSSPTPVTIEATYRVGGGPLGNVSRGTEFRSALPSIRRAVSLDDAAGGAPLEALERARRLAPRLFRSQDRAVTTEDVEDLALQVPGVGKARAIAANWNQIALYVAPTGKVGEPSELLRRDLLAFFESRRMVTTELIVLGPKPADIYLAADVQAQPFYLTADVERAIEEAVARYFDFDAISFGQPLYLSRIYDLIQSLPQVASLLVTRFSRQPNGGVDADGTIALDASELPRLGYRDNPTTPANPATPAFRPAIVLQVRGAVG
jgi:predicted phage baseplate assembly protein